MVSHFCPGFSGTAFSSASLPTSLGPSQPLVWFCALLSRLLWDSHLRVLAYLVAFPSFLEMHGLGDFDAALDSVALISLIECISMELLLLPPGSFGSFCFVRVPAFLGPSPTNVCFCALLSRLVWDSLYGSWLIRRGPSPIFSRFMMWLISMHRLTVWHWYHSLNAPSWCCLPDPLGASVFLGSRLLWFPPTRCVNLLFCPGSSGAAFSSIRFPVSLGSSQSLLCFCFSVLSSLGQLLFC